MAKTDVNELVKKFYCLSVVAHIAHENTRSFSQHKALGEFYDKVSDFKDRLVEYLVGMEYLDMVDITDIEVDDDVMEEAEDACYALDAFASETDDTALLNMAGDFKEMKGRLKYLLLLK